MLSEITSAIITMPSFAYGPGSKNAPQRYLSDLRSTTDPLAVGGLAEGAFYTVEVGRPDIVLVLSKLFKCYSSAFLTNSEFGRTLWPTTMHYS